MSRSTLLTVLVGLLMASSIAMPFEGGYTKTKEARIKKVKFNGKILEVPEEDVDPFHRPIPADEGFSPDAFQTDMMLNAEQKSALNNNDGTRSKRKAIKDETRYWPKVITDQATGQHIVKVPYKFDTTNNLDVPAIEAAMAHWQDQTCVRFVPSSNSQENRLLFFKDQGCYSYVGMQGGSQKVSIGDGCSQLGTVSHEIGHALGFNHEQSRPDRDQYVTINEANIKSGYLNNFDKESTNDAMSNLPYDYSSAMHYGPYGFGINTNEPTLIPKDPFAMSVIGQREGLSFLDVKLANMMYQCDSHCSGADPCHTGFRDMNCNCRCPADRTGNNCEISQEANMPVQQIVLTAASGEVASPNYDGTKTYPENTSVMTYIKGEPDEQIRLKFDFFELEAYDTTNKKCWDYVDIKADNVFYNGVAYCGNTLPPEVVANEIMLSFHSDESYVGRGFHGIYTKEKVSGGGRTCPEKLTCTGTIDLPAGCETKITSPNFPANYPNSETCTYTINASAGTTIELAFDSIDTESGYDYISVSTGTVNKRFEGTSLPAGYLTSTNSMTVTFKSDYSVTRSGFSATIKGRV